MLTSILSQFPNKSETTIRWLQKDETTFYMDEMQLRERWQYYISSFIRVEPTEGVPRSRMQKVVLARNLPAAEVDGDGGGIPKPVAYDESLVISICLNSSKMVWTPHTYEYFVYDRTPKTAAERERRKAFLMHTSRRRAEKTVENMVHNTAWMRNKNQEEVQKINAEFRRWMQEGVLPENAEGDAMDTAE